MPLSLLLLLHVAQAFLGARRLYPEQAGAHLWTGGSSMQAMMEDKMEDNNIKASMEPHQAQRTTEEYSALHSSQVKLHKKFTLILIFIVGNALLY
jgi:hypothetical protein